MRSSPNPLNLQNFNGRLLMCLGQCATRGCLVAELDSAQLAGFQRPMRKHVASTIRIVPGILSDPQRGILRMPALSVLIRQFQISPVASYFPLCVTIASPTLSDYAFWKLSHN